jgi:hypothetical protein
MIMCGAYPLGKLYIYVLEKEFEDAERKYAGQMDQDFDNGTDMYSDNKICSIDQGKHSIVSQEMQPAMSTSNSASENPCDMEFI